MDDFWKRYEKALEDGYFKMVDGKKCLKEEFIVEYPIKIVEMLKYDRNDKSKSNNKDKNKVSQLWKFYDHARRIQDSLRLKGGSLDVLRAELCELMPAANYALERKNVTVEFKQFIDFNVSRIKDKDDLAAFIKHFQSVIAYLPKEKQK